MVDVDRRMTGLNPSHIAGLRRLSSRAAAAAAPPSAAPAPTRQSFQTLAEKLITHLKKIKIQVEPGLSGPEFARAEAEFGFVFPPDLKAVLALGLPIGPGFPNWRCSGLGRAQLRASISLPAASVSFHVARNSLWSKAWGPKPADPETALKTARNFIKRAPVLIPVFNHCYIPASPVLAGNPVFFVDENRIFCCGSDLSGFFDSIGSGLAIPGSGPARWVEFWTDATIKRNSGSGSTSATSSPDQVLELTRPTRNELAPLVYDSWFHHCRPETPKWVEEYLNRVGSVLKTGGWGEDDVAEIVQVAASGFFEDEMVCLDGQAVRDALLLKTDRFSCVLRESGWSSEEVSEALGFDFGPEKGKRVVKKLAPELVERFGKLARSVSRSS